MSVGAITDVPGVLVGHHQRIGRGWRTGTTVVVAPGGATPGVDVRGGGPGTRETDALRPGTLVPTIHAVCLSGGSAFGLAAADGVAAWLAARGRGFPVGLDDEPGRVVPVVPAAVIFDLGRGGRFDHRPTAEFGARAAARARSGAVRRGAVGAGTGAVAGLLQGGVGTAAVHVGDVAVGALAVVNASGRTVDPATGLPWCPDGFALRRPSPAERRAVRAATAPTAARPAPLNTTIGVVATSAALTKTEASRLAAAAHDGLARAVRPAHSMFDGDTVFAMATGDVVLPAPTEPARGAEPAALRPQDPAGRFRRVDELLEAASRCFTLACTDAVLAARSHGTPPAYRDLCPSVFGPAAATR